MGHVVGEYPNCAWTLRQLSSLILGSRFDVAATWSDFPHNMRQITRHAKTLQLHVLLSCFLTVGHIPVFKMLAKECWIAGSLARWSQIIRGLQQELKRRRWSHRAQSRQVLISSWMRSTAQVWMNSSNICLTHGNGQRPSGPLPVAISVGHAGLVIVMRIPSTSLGTSRAQFSL
eukprot:5507215-Amphidinium_carterae.1